MLNKLINYFEYIQCYLFIGATKLPNKKKIKILAYTIENWFNNIFNKQITHFRVTPWLCLKILTTHF